MSQLRIHELTARLASRLDSTYLIGGEEPLLIEEALSALREAVRAWGAGSREVLHADAAFEWNRLLAARDSLSLFAERRFIELRLPSGKPGKEGAKALQAYAAQPPDDAVLAVVCGRLERQQRDSAWARALGNAGVMAYAWPLASAELPRWLARRLQARGLRASRAALDILAERAEGNLLAAAQEIDKLELLHGAGELDEETVREAVADNARFDVFDLSEAVLRGDRRRANRVVSALREAGTEPTLVLWVLARDLRVLALLRGAGAPSAQQVFTAQRIWRAQQARYQRGARAAPAARWEALLRDAAAADRVIKGAAPGRPWEELVNLAVNMAACAAGASNSVQGAVER